VTSARKRRAGRGVAGWTRLLVAVVLLAVVGVFAVRSLQSPEKGIDDVRLKRDRFDATRALAASLVPWFQGWLQAGGDEATQVAATARTAGPDRAVNDYNAKGHAFGQRAVVVRRSGPNGAPTVLAGARNPGFNGISLSDCAAGIDGLAQNALRAGGPVAAPSVFDAPDRVWVKPDGVACGRAMGAAAPVDADRVAVVLGGPQPPDVAAHLAPVLNLAATGKNVWPLLEDGAGQVVASVPAGLQKHSSSDSGVVSADALIGQTSWRLVVEQASADFNLTEGQKPSSKAAAIVAACFLFVILVIAAFDVRRRRALRRADADRAEFLAIVGHELRTPLTVLKGFVETLAGRWDTLEEEQRRNVVERLLPQTRRLNRVVDRLLTAADIQAGAVVAPSMEAVELEPLLGKVASQFKAIAPLHRFEIAAEPGVAALADRKSLERVLEQLVDNAVKFSPSGGSVRLAAERRKRRVELTVEDEGVGLPDTRRKIFEAFVQGEAVDNRVHAEGGVGVGLFIVRALLADMGGTVGTESRSPDPGARFVVTLRSAPMTERDGAPLARRARVHSPK